MWLDVWRVAVAQFSGRSLSDAMQAAITGRVHGASAAAIESGAACFGPRQRA